MGYYKSHDVSFFHEGKYPITYYITKGKVPDYWTVLSLIYQVILKTSLWRYPSPLKSSDLTMIMQRYGRERSY
jgi:hypothetical protein